MDPGDPLLSDEVESGDEVSIEDESNDGATTVDARIEDESTETASTDDAIAEEESAEGTTTDDAITEDECTETTITDDATTENVVPVDPEDTPWPSSTRRRSSSPKERLPIPKPSISEWETAYLHLQLLMETLNLIKLGKDQFTKDEFCYQIDVDYNILSTAPSSIDLSIDTTINERKNLKRAIMFNSMLVWELCEIIIHPCYPNLVNEFGIGTVPEIPTIHDGDNQEKMRKYRNKIAHMYRQPPTDRTEGEFNSEEIWVWIDDKVSLMRGEVYVLLHKCDAHYRTKTGRDAPERIVPEAVERVLPAVPPPDPRPDGDDDDDAAQRPGPRRWEWLPDWVSEWPGNKRKRFINLLASAFKLDPPYRLWEEQADPHAVAWNNEEWDQGNEAWDQGDDEGEEEEEDHQALTRDFEEFVDVIQEERRTRNLYGKTMPQGRLGKRSSSSWNHYRVQKERKRRHLI